MTEAAPTQTLEFQEALELVMASILEDEWFMDVYGNMCKSQTSTKTYTKQPWFSGRAFFCDRKSKIKMIRGWAKPCQGQVALYPSPSDRKTTAVDHLALGES
jgi:hypothetical protein